LISYYDRNIKIQLAKIRIQKPSQKTIAKEPSMVRYGQDHAAQTRAAIVEAAAELLRSKGYAETSVGTVMKAVGLTNGGFYAHFADKTALLNAATARAFAQSPVNFSALAGMAKASGDAGLIAKHYLADSRVEAVATGCPAAALVSELHRQDASVRATFQAGAEDTVRSLSEAPGLAKEEHAFDWATLAMLVGGLSMMRAMPETALRDKIRHQIIHAMRALATSEAPTL
jgi:TetR/AcrR family transcriptional regulator, transcriptional repressor for nem operon